MEVAMINEVSPSSLQAEETLGSDTRNKSNRFHGITEERLAVVRTKLDEIGQAPHPGRLARKIRKRRGLSVEDAAALADVDLSFVEFFEETGVARTWSDSEWLDSPFGDDDDDESHSDAVPLDRLIEVLQPSEQEARELRRDLRDDAFWMGSLLKELIPEDLWKELAEAQPSDPWETKSERKGRNRLWPRGMPLSPMSAVGSQSREQHEIFSTVGTTEAEHEVSGQRMRFKLQLIAMTEGEERLMEIAVLDKSFSCIEQVGLTLSEAKTILRQVQCSVLEHQVRGYLETRSRCEYCGRPLSRKGGHEVTFRTLFGNVTLHSPRLRSCPCHSSEKASFSPLAVLFPERTSPELLFMEAKWASLVSYGLTAKILQEFLPVDEKLSPNTVRNHALGVAERCESEIGEERTSFVEGCPAQWKDLPEPAGPITIGIDGGYLGSDNHWNEMLR